MSYALRIPRTFSAGEYLLVERNAAYKSELIGGTIYAMAGASENHITINLNIAAMVHIQLRGSGCRAFGSDMKVRTTPEGLFAYPDLSVVCGERRFHDAARDVLVNPVALFEILSPSTALFDRGDKFLMYQELDTLMDYVLIAQSEPRIEHFVRQENGLWLPTLAHGREASITLSSAAVTLPLVEIYENVDFKSA